MLQIRKIKPEDIGFVIQLAVQNKSDGGRLLSNIEGFLICEDNNEKCGCGCLIRDGNTGYLSWIMIREEDRRKKLGSAITKALLNIADLNGIKEVYSAGICGDFLKALGFEGSEDAAFRNKLMELLGRKEVEAVYKVKLEGYFKPCTNEK